MTISALFSALVVSSQLLLALTRMLGRNKSVQQTIITAYVGAVVASIAFVSAIRSESYLFTILTIPYLTYLTWISWFDPTFPKAFRRNRAWVTVAPIVAIIITVLINNRHVWDMLRMVPLASFGSATVVMFFSSKAAWSDYRRIRGLTADDQDAAEEGARRAYQPSDTVIWIRVIAHAATISFTCVQSAFIIWEPYVEELSVRYLVVGILSLVFPALILYRSKRGYDTVPGVDIGLLASQVLLVTSTVVSSLIVDSNANLSQYSMGYLFAIGVAIGILYCEDVIVSFYWLNRHSLNASVIVFSSLSGLLFGIQFVAVSRVSFLENGVLAISRVTLMGAFLILTWVCSMLILLAFVRRLPSRHMTLKSPGDIVLSDQTMFIGIMGGCVTGASLICHGQSPGIVRVICGLVFLFVLFARNNDMQHLRNEKDRLECDTRWSTEDVVSHIRCLKGHLRFQRWVVYIICFASFAWSFVDVVLSL